MAQPIPLHPAPPADDAQAGRQFVARFIREGPAPDRKPMLSELPIMAPTRAKAEKLAEVTAKLAFANLHWEPGPGAPETVKLVSLVEIAHSASNDPPPPPLDLGDLSLELKRDPERPCLRDSPALLLLLAQSSLVGLNSLIQTRGLSLDERVALEGQARPLARQLSQITRWLGPEHGDLDEMTPQAASAIACQKVLERQLGGLAQ